MSENRLELTERVQRSLDTWDEEARFNEPALASLATKVGAELPEDISITIYSTGEATKMRGAQGRSFGRLAPEIHPVRANRIQVVADPSPTTEVIREAIAESMFNRYDLNPGLRKHFRRWRQIGAAGYSAAAAAGIGAVTAHTLTGNEHAGPIMGGVAVALGGLTEYTRNRFWNSRKMPDVSNDASPVEIV